MWELMPPSHLYLNCLSWRDYDNIKTNMTDEELVLIPTKDLNKVVKESGWLFLSPIEVDHLDDDDDDYDDDGDDDDDDDDDDGHRFDQGGREEDQREEENFEEQVSLTDQLYTHVSYDEIQKVKTLKKTNR